MFRNLSNGPRPRVSIGLPVYNGEPYLRQALGDLLAQDFEDFELIVSDNASTDATEKICRSIRDPRVKYFRNERNLGAQTNFDRVLAKASAPLFMWAAHDDRWAPSFLSRCVEALDANPDAVLAAPSVRYIDEDGNPAGPFRDNFDTRGMGRLQRIRRIFSGTTWCWIYGLIRRDALRKAWPSPVVWGGDAVLILRLAQLGTFVKVEEPLFSYRVFLRKTIRDAEAAVDPSKQNHPAPFWQMLRALATDGPPDAGAVILASIFLFNPRLRHLLWRDAVRVVTEFFAEPSAPHVICSENLRPQKNTA